MLFKNIYQEGTVKLCYYEIRNDLQPLVLLHAQGVDALSFQESFSALSKKYHIYSVDCYGHGGSLHQAEKYNIADIGTAILSFLENVVKRKVYLLGHSSGGLIAAYIAAHTDLCEKLILEDPPFFASQGERRKRTYNYVDLSTVCHDFLRQTESKDFVLYYFANQYAWNLFPDRSREKVKEKLVNMAAKYRKKHPDKDLKVLFWPKAALSGFQGMNNYDPRFGEAFYDDSFHSHIPHEDLLKNIKCETVFLKARTNQSQDGILMGALSDEDTKRVLELVDQCRVIYFDCGHGIHIEKTKEFIACLADLLS